MQLPRRRFIKFITFGTATSIVAGKLWQREVLAFCVPLPDQKEAVFKVRISDFPALQQDWGSVRLGINPVRPDVQPYPDGAFYHASIRRRKRGRVGASPIPGRGWRWPIAPDWRSSIFGEPSPFRMAPSLS